MGNRILELNNIKKSYNSLEVINELSLHLLKGEIVALLGPSGCGKTTLFRMIAGLTFPDRGQINITPGIRVAYVFQEPRLLPWKTVEENVAFVQNNFLSGSEASNIRDNLLSISGLDSFKNKFPNQLSGGMKQRLELIRALAIKPDLLLMDEPFKSLDTVLKMTLRKLIVEQWSEKGFGILLITHDPEMAVMLADRIFILSERPATIVREIRIEKEQRGRSFRDNSVYKSLENILNMLMEA